MSYSDAVTNYTNKFTDEGFQDSSDKGQSVEITPENNSKPAEEAVSFVVEEDDGNELMPQSVPSQSSALQENEYSEDTSTDHQPQKKKKKNSVQQRIDQLSYAIGERDQYNAFLQQQLADKEARLAQQQKDLELYQKSLVQKDNESFENQGARIKSQEQIIRRELKAAIESGDTDAQTDLMAHLADIKAEEKALMLRRQNDMQRAQDAYQYADQYTDYAPVESPVSNYNLTPVQNFDEDYQNWIEENPWYVNDNGLRQEADQIASELHRYCSLNNIRVSQNDIRNKVVDELKRKYGGQRNPMTNNNDSTRYISPVSQGNPMNSNAMNTPPGTVRLTKKQFEFARTLPSKFPGETHNQKAARYAAMIEPIPKTEDGVPIYKIRFE